jgi:hypothetical protein
MECYPRELIAQKSFSMLTNPDVSKYYFVRETEENLSEYPQNEQDDISNKIVEPMDLQEVFELSMILFGYYNTTHVGIRANIKIKDDIWSPGMENLHPWKLSSTKKNLFPLYLKAEMLDNKSITYNQQYMISFSHVPMRSKYWHFQLWVEDASGNRIKRKSKDELLAHHILSEYVHKAICPAENVSSFNRNDFDNAFRITPLKLLLLIFDYFK